MESEVERLRSERDAARCVARELNQVCPLCKGWRWYGGEICSVCGPIRAAWLEQAKEQLAAKAEMESKQ